MSDMTMNEQMLAILKAFPNKAILVTSDSVDCRAMLVDRPIPAHYTPTVTECRLFPEDAIERLHEKLVESARDAHGRTGEHLSKLNTRLIEKAQPRPSGSTASEGE